MPKAKTENFLKAPPEKRSMTSKRPPPPRLSAEARFSAFTPGTLTCTPTNPLAAGTQYTIHVGGGMTDAQGHMMDLDSWTSMGGEWATGGMMGGTHAGQPIGMMGPGWMHGSAYGMLFTFTTS